MKNLVRLTLALALLVPVGVTAAAPAGAAGALVTCKAPSGKLTITPGLSTVAKIQTTIINLPITGCTGPGGVKSGTSKGTTKGTKATTCAQFFANPANTNLAATTTWNTKATSTFSGTTKISASKGALLAAVTAKITKGLFKGKTLTTTVKVTLVGSCGAGKTLKTILITGTKPLVIK